MKEIVALLIGVFFLILSFSNIKFNLKITLGLFIFASIALLSLFFNQNNVSVLILLQEVIINYYLIFTFSVFLIISAFKRSRYEEKTFLDENGESELFVYKLFSIIFFILFILSLIVIFVLFKINWILSIALSSLTAMPFAALFKYIETLKNRSEKYIFFICSLLFLISSLILTFKI